MNCFSTTSEHDILCKPQLCQLWRPLGTRSGSDARHHVPEKGLLSFDLLSTNFAVHSDVGGAIQRIGLQRKGRPYQERQESIFVAWLRIVPHVNMHVSQRCCAGERLVYVSPED